MNNNYNNYSFVKNSSCYINFVIIGIDEVGRGAWAGPLVGAAVGISPEAAEALLALGLDDSKRLSAKKRQELAAHIRQQAAFLVVKSVSVAIIDEHGIGQANIALFNQLMAACPVNDGIRIDGRRLGAIEAEFLIDGDAIEPAIMAGSIVAKVARDGFMTTLATEFPAYGFDRHVGYGTRFHQLALQKYGPSPHHRHSFKPIQRLLSLNQPELS